MTKKLKMLGNSLIVFAALATMLIVINRYMFSWTGFILNGIGLCEYKSIGVPVWNGLDKKLSYVVDFKQIAAALNSNPNYEPIRYDNYGLVVSRKYGDVRYDMVFHNSFEDGTTISKFNLHTWRLNSISHGEKCSTPTYYIERNVYRMVDDLPLSPSQKSELKENVQILPTVNGRLF